MSAGLPCKGRGSQMVRVSVEAGSGAARFRDVQQLGQRVGFAKSHNLDKECKVTFLLDPEAYFIEEPVAGVDVTAA